MVQFILAGLVLGSIYAISALGVIVTYVSAGILNFAFAAMAYFVARFYYFLLVEHHWPILPAALISIGVVGPVFGVFLWAVLFRYLRTASPLIKIVSTIGLSVAIPPIAAMIFGNQTIQIAPGLAPEPVRVFHVLGVAVTLDQVIVYACMLLTVVVGGVILRFTSIGMRVRALVDSQAMAALSGISPQRMSAAVWALSTFFAGLAGILVAPIIGLDMPDFTFLMASAFAAVIAARLTSMGVAVIVGLLMGVVTSLAQGYLPPSSTLAADIIPSIPFIFLVLFVFYFISQSGAEQETAVLGGALDRAIAPSGYPRDVAGHDRALTVSANRSPIRLSSIVGLAVLAILPIVLHGFWIGLVGQGLAYGVFFLSYTLVTGEGGMIWLCQITFAGIGAITTAQLATQHGWPVLAALVVGGLVCAGIGMVIGILTIRLGDLYVALATLTFGVLIGNLVFTNNTFSNYGVGVPLHRPEFAQGNRAFSWFVLLVFVLLAIFTLNYRRSTGGMALNAARWSRPAARLIGIQIIPTKVFVSTVAAFIAGVGGGLLACYANAAIPTSYDVFTGLIWFAVLVTVGIRSVGAAVVAGLSLSFAPVIFVTYLPNSWGQVPTALFGVGAVLVVKNPDGTLETQARQIEAAWSRWRPRRGIPTGSRSSEPAKDRDASVSAQA